MKERFFATSVIAILLSALLCVSRANAQEGSIQEAEQLNEQATELYRQARYKEAISAAQRALAINEKAVGLYHASNAALLNNLALFYYVTGAYAKAEPLLQRALAINEVLGPNHPDTAASINNLAELYRATGAYAKAGPLYQRALKIHEEVFGLYHPETAVSLNSIAGFFEATGAYAKAEPLYERALAIREKALPPNDPDTATSLNNLALLYDHTGAYAKATPLLRRALAINEKAYGLDHPQTALSLNNLAMHLAHLYGATDAYAKAEPLLQRALAINEKALGAKHPDTATSVNNLAQLYSTTGTYAKAEPLYQRALAIRKKMLDPNHPDTAKSLNNLASLYRATNAYAKAEPLYQRALAIEEKALGPDHPDTATSLNGLAALYRDTGAYAQAEPLMERAQRIVESNTARFLLSGSETRKRAYLEQRVGDTYANVSFSLSVADPRAKALGLTGVLQYKGRALDAMSDSVARLRQSVAPQDRALFEELTEVAQQFSILTFRGPGNLPVDAYRQRLKTLAQQQERLETELANRSSAFRQAVTPITLEGVQQALPVDALLVEWFRYRPFDAKLKGDARRGEPRYMAYVLKRSGDAVAIDLGPAQPIEVLIGELRGALSDPKNTTYQEVAKELSEILIAPLRAHLEQGERLLLSPDGMLNLVPFGALVDEHGEYLAQRFELTYLTSGRDLLRMAVALPARSSAVVMADPAYGQSAGKAAAVDPSLQPSRSNDLDRSGLVFTPLAGTADEAKALQALLKLNEQHVLIGANATETHLKQLHGPRLLHVATHGFFLNDREVAALTLKPVGLSPEVLPLPLGENPLLRSGLALAGANVRHSGESDDGILTAAEAAQLDLGGTQLVVLSACDTGVGQVQTGEGVYGLRRALVLAGAQTQVTSLWKVDDPATQELMVDYYQRLLKGEGRSGALRAAQKTMMAIPERQHPYYWAAFVPIGNWTPLPAAR